MSEKESPSGDNEVMSASEGRCNLCKRILPEARLFDAVECGCGEFYRVIEGAWSHLPNDLDDTGVERGDVRWRCEELLAVLARKPELNDDERKLVGGYKLVLALMNENEELRERLQIDPGGSDKIDELEQAAQFLRHTIQTLDGRLKGLESAINDLAEHTGWTEADWVRFEGLLDR